MSDKRSKTVGVKVTPTVKPISPITLNRNISLGFSVEALYEDIFRKLGFHKCKSTRFSSRMLDNCKVDFINLPVLIQLKAGIQDKLNPVEILKSMEKLLSYKFTSTDKIHSMPKLVIHHKPKKVTSRKRDKYDSLVTMAFEDLVPLLVAYQKMIENDTQK